MKLEICRGNPTSTNHAILRYHLSLHNRQVTLTWRSPHTQYRSGSREAFMERLAGSAEIRAIGTRSGGHATVVGISARIYRVGILMYGKRPSVIEILRWLKYS